MGDIRVVIQKPLNGGSGGGIPEAPNDGEQYGRQNETWTPISQTGGGVDSVTGDGVGGTATNVVMSFPTASDLALTTDDISNESTEIPGATQTDVNDTISTALVGINDLKANKATLTQDGGNVTGSIDTDANTFTLNSPGGGGSVTASNGLTKVANDIKLGGDFTEDTGIGLDGNSLQIMGNGANLIFIINDHADPADNYIDIKCGDNVIDMQQQYIAINSGDNTGVEVSVSSGIKLTTDEDINIVNPLATDETITKVIGRDSNGNLKEVDKVSTTTSNEPTGSTQVLNMVSLTQAEYDAGTKNATTFYIITDA